MNAGRGTGPALKRAAVATLLGCLLLATLAWLALDTQAQMAQGGPGINWWVVAGGGGPAAGSGGVALDVTLGQPIAGPSAAGGGGMTLAAGYWHGPVAVASHRVYLPLLVK